MRILILKTSSLGDIVQTFPVLEYLHQKIKDAAIDWVVEKHCAELVDSHPFLRKIFRVDTKQWRSQWTRETVTEISEFLKEIKSTAYDVVFDLQGNLKSGLILSQIKCSKKVGFGKKSVPEWPNLFFTSQKYDPPKSQNIRSDYLSVVQQFFKDITNFEGKGVLLNTNNRENCFADFPNNGEIKAIVAVGTNWKNKQLPLETLQNFLNRISQNYPLYFYLLWGNHEEYLMAQNLQKAISNSAILPKYTLSILQNVMGKMDLVIANDSLPLHLAGSAGVPTFSFFGPSSAEKYKPLGKSHFAYQGHCPYHRTFDKRCPILRSCQTGACMNNITAAELNNAFNSWWRSLILK